MKNTQEKQAITVVTGSPDHLGTYIYNIEESYVWVREAVFETGKGGEDITIIQITDPHFNYLNERDFEENDHAIMSTYEHRMWLKNGESVDVMKRALKYASRFDQTVVTGDVLDYLSHGAIELMHKVIWDKYPDTIITTGNHEFSRCCEGKVADTMPLERKYEILKSVWKHDPVYYSRVLGDKVAVVSIDDGNGRFTREQCEKLSAEIKRARDNRYIILMFMHQPLCTYNPDEKAVDSLVILSNDDRNHCDMNFCDTCVGNPGDDEDTLALHGLITSSPDVIKGVFTGHFHTNFYTEIVAKNPDGQATVIPQYVLPTTASFNHPHVVKITVK